MSNEYERGHAAGREAGIREAVVVASGFGCCHVAEEITDDILALLDDPAPVETFAGVTVQEARTVTDRQEAIDRLLTGDTIAYSRDGDDAWFTKGDRSFVAGRVVIGLRKDGMLARKSDDEGYCVWDEASPALRALSEDRT